MKKLSLLFLSLFLVLGACSQSATSDPITLESNETLPDTWEEFNGYAIDSTTENGVQQTLVVKGVTKNEVADKSVKEIMKEAPAEDAIWFTDKQISLEKVEIGDKVSVWWDTGKPHVEPGILTVPAEKIKISN